MSINELRGACRDQTGASMVEYILIVVLIAVGLISVLVMFRDSLGGLFYKGGGGLDAADGGSYTTADAPGGVHGGAGGGFAAPAAGSGAAAIGPGLSAPGAGGDLASPGGVTHEQAARAANGSIQPHSKKNRVEAPNYSRDELHNLYGDEKAYQAELERQRWNLIVRYMILGLAIAVFIGLIIMTTIRVRVMFKQARNQ
ncbi:Flp family type IVb pilin [bacterium]|nr:Flp family type IVb pilin [candidate division CSSED10-310 bacterium]